MTGSLGAPGSGSVGDGTGMSTGVSAGISSGGGGWLAMSILLSGQERSRTVLYPERVPEPSPILSVRRNLGRAENASTGIFRSRCPVTICSPTPLASSTLPALFRQRSFAIFPEPWPLLLCRVPCDFPTAGPHSCHWLSRWPHTKPARCVFSATETDRYVLRHRPIAAGPRCAKRFPLP